MPTALTGFSGKNDVKTTVLELLSERWPLSAKQIHRAVLSKLDGPLTYQAVHKSLGELCRVGMLEKTPKGYGLNPQWISRVKQFAERADKKYKDQPNLDFAQMQDAGAVTLVFNSYLEALYALLENIEKESIQFGDDVTIRHWRHPWPITCVSDKQYDQVKKIMSIGKHYALVSQITALDKVLARFWKDLGKHILVGVPCAKDCDLLITQDKIVQVSLEPKLFKALDRVFNQSRTGTELSGLYDKLFRLKGKVTLVITKNKTLAEQISRETLKQFKNPDKNPKPKTRR